MKKYQSESVLYFQPYWILVTLLVWVQWKKGEKYNQYLHLDNQQQRIEQAAMAKARL